MIDFSCRSMKWEFFVAFHILEGSHVYNFWMFVLLISRLHLARCPEDFYYENLEFVAYVLFYS